MLFLINTLHKFYINKVYTFKIKLTIYINKYILNKEININTSFNLS